MDENNVKNSEIFKLSSAERILREIFQFFYRCLRGAANRLLKSKNNPRRFSNNLLRYYGPFFKGRIINVSGWDDRDGEGGFYRDYFPDKTDYVVSNMADEYKGMGSVENQEIKEIAIDLSVPLNAELVGKYDTVLNHTTLEHIFKINIAFENICKLSREAVILVVPVLQNIHIKSYGDFWRPTTLGIAKLFISNGFQPLVICCNDQPFAPVYCFAIAVRDVKKYKDKIEPTLNFEMGAKLYGSGLKKRYINKILK